jgi:GNAT superfamily N-acetyltransferase
MIIRAATTDDTEAVVDIYVESSNAGFIGRLAHKVADTDRIESWRLDLSDATPTRWWLALQNDTAVGFVGIGPCRDPVEPGLGELDTIAVRPEAWHRGVGKALMVVALQQLHQAGFMRATLWTLNNYPLAERFYRSTGWRLNGASRDGGQQVRYDHALPASDPSLTNADQTLLHG